VKVLFVCGGNTCRSPFAAGYARTLGLDAESAGLYVIRREEADADAVAAAAELGVDLDEHRARSISEQLVGENDIVVTMTADQLEEANRLGARRARTLLANDDVEDPVGRGGDEYRRVYAQIAGAMPSLVEELRA
jgi:protein-tyrosine phosphatase